MRAIREPSSNIAHASVMYHVERPQGLNHLATTRTSFGSLPLVV